MPSGVPDPTLFVFDIETIPDTDAVPGLTGVSDPDVAVRRQALTDYHLSVTGGKNAFLRQPFHKVVAISFLDAEIGEDGGRETYHLNELRSGGREDFEEKLLVQGFFQHLRAHRPRLVSFNGRGFDLAVLRYRAMVHGIDAGFLYSMGDRWNSYTARYSDDWHCDLMDVLSDYGASARVGLQEVCAVMGLPGKIGVNGADVAGLVDSGKVGAVRDYCETDVLNTYLVYLRHMLHRGRINTDGYNQAIGDIIALIDAEGGTRPHLAAFLDAWGAASGNQFMF